MLSITIIAAGKQKDDPAGRLTGLYTERIRWPVTFREIVAKSTDPERQNREENDKILKAIPDGARVIALDERGKSVRSTAFADMLGQLQNEGVSSAAFIIGGNSGLTEDVRRRADFLLSFGAQTWPHMLARAMLMEQIYRARQILDGHPYHKE